MIPFVGIIPAKYIAGVMNDGKFSAHMISEDTQIVMMDEWTPQSLTCEDAKRILQGRCLFSLLVACFVFRRACAGILMIKIAFLFLYRWSRLHPTKA